MMRERFDSAESGIVEFDWVGRSRLDERRWWWKGVASAGDANCRGCELRREMLLMTLPDEVAAEETLRAWLSLSPSLRAVG